MKSNNNKHIHARKKTDPINSCIQILKNFYNNTPSANLSPAIVALKSAIRENIFTLKEPYEAKTVLEKLNIVSKKIPKADDFLTSGLQSNFKNHMLRVKHDIRQVEEESQRQQEEELLRQQEEQRRQQEEQRQRQLEKEHQRQQKEQRRQQEEQRRQQEEESQRQQEEQRRQQEEQRRQQEEESQRQQEEESQRQRRDRLDDAVYTKRIASENTPEHFFYQFLKRLNNSTFYESDISHLKQYGLINKMANSDIPIPILAIDKGCSTYYLRSLVNAGYGLHDKYNGCSTLHYAVEKNNPDLVKYILEQEPYLVKQKDNNGNTALHYALSNNRDIGIIKSLLSSGSDIYTKNNREDSAIDFALASNNPIIRNLFGITERVALRPYQQNKESIYLSTAQKASIGIELIGISMLIAGIVTSIATLSIVAFTVSVLAIPLMFISDNKSHSNNNRSRNNYSELSSIPQIEIPEKHSKLESERRKVVIDTPSHRH